MIDLSLSRYVSVKQDVEDALETGFNEYDNHIFGLKLQELSVWVGRNGEGKSTVASQVIAHNLKLGNKVYLYSGELSENKVQHWLYSQLVGADNKWYEEIETRFGKTKQVKKEAVYAIKKWHFEKLYGFDRATKRVRNNLELLYKDMHLASQQGVHLFFIDNLMTAMEENTVTVNADQSNFLQWCKDFAVKTNSHVVVLVHPNQGPKELEVGAKHGNIQKNDISGTNNIPNKADNILAIERVWKYNNSKDKELKGGPDAIFTSLKDRWDGIRKTMFFMYSQKSRRYYNDRTRECVNYGWEMYLNEGIDKKIAVD